MAQCGHIRYSAGMTGQVSDRYDACIRAGDLRDDAAQREAARRLDRLAHELEHYRPQRRSRLIGKLLSRNGRSEAPRGLYLWGPVGRGKTMLMDLFFDAVAFAPKRREHFLSFMQDVHARIDEVRRGQRSGEIWEDADPLRLVARSLAQDALLLCLDEFQVNDIADAMILGRLFEALFAEGLVVVATSNQEPDALYRDGLNRNAFLPFIDVLKANLKVTSLASDTDYRLGRLAGRQVYFTPLGNETDAALQDLWERLTETDVGEREVLRVAGRDFVVPQAARGAARFTFSWLCERPVGAAEYQAVARDFTTCFIEHIPVIAREERDVAARFITLIDTLYDRRVRLVASAEAEPHSLYSDGPQARAFERTASRLHEMRSGEYWSQPAHSSPA